MNKQEIAQAINSAVAELEPVIAAQERLSGAWVHIRQLFRDAALAGKIEDMVNEALACSTAAASSKPVNVFAAPKPERAAS